MTYTELKQKVEQQLTQLSPNELSLVSNFLDSLQDKSPDNKRSLRRMAPLTRGMKPGDLLKFAGTWQGDDLEKCLQFVKDTRSKTEF